MSRSISPFERFGEFLPQEDANLEEYTWNASDTISGLAHRRYGDWRLWRIIAERNGIADVRQIQLGTILIIPELPLQRSEFEVAD